MESILARALEYTLKYWLKSFSRDQFKLQGRTVQLSNLDINGEALHASMGLPPALNVTTAKVGKLEIILPYVSNVQIEPIVVQIDRLDLVLEENLDVDSPRSSSSMQSSTTSGKGSGYGFADKIADGMTLQVQTVNLLLETHGGARCKGGAAWASPMASITMRNILLYTTNENWQVVNLKEARDFSSKKNLIYVFKKLECESLSIDLLPHPDMFTDANLARSQEGATQRDDDGAKRIFFGGERFLEGISGEAYITVQRTELNSPLGLEVQLHVTEAVCPALSEPGLRALLRFLTGLYVCLNRGDVDLKAQQRSVESAGRSLVCVIVDHIFLCIKDTEFQLELLMQSLLFSRASVSDGENSRNLSKVMIGGLFLRDTFSRPLCTLVQPSMKAVADSCLQIPEFGGTFGGVKDDSFLHLGMPDDVDVSIELQDWLFALEGVQEMAERWWFEKEVLGREQRCWHTTFRSLQVKAKSSPKDVPNGKGISHGIRGYPVELVTVSVEGLQTLKPQAHRCILQDVSPANGFKESFETLGGVNLEVRMVISEDNLDNEMVNWVVENLKFSVKQPIEAVVTKDELQHLASVCKSEVDSMGRIAAGVLRLLKLEKSLGKEAIDKLSNLGTDGFDKIFSSDKLGRGSSAGSIGQSPPKVINEDQRSTVALLEEAVSDSQAKCAALVTQLSKSESSKEHLTNIKELRQKLEGMQSLLVQLRGQM